jgi:PHP family Zn ribbon phosphoesterase
MEIIAFSIKSSVASIKTKTAYEKLLHDIGSELFILREASLKDIERAADSRIAEGIQKLRSGEVVVQPGYDGRYGKISK